MTHYALETLSLSRSGNPKNDVIEILNSISMNTQRMPTDPAKLSVSSLCLHVCVSHTQSSTPSPVQLPEQHRNAFSIISIA